MKVSEVEGDAVLFYKHNEVPSVEAILSQSEKMFVAFHEQLARYESERICQCGACTTAHDLTLKFVAHTGEIGFTNIKNTKKPFGTPLVEAHTLLKNSINDNEYILMTDAFRDQILSSKYVSITSPWIKIIGDNDKKEQSGLKYFYIPLKPLHEKVKQPSPPQPPPKISNPVTVKASISKPLYLVFELVSNLEFRLAWNKGVKELVYEQGKTNRVGTKHRCLFDNGFADFETITNEFGPYSVVYGEKIESIPIADHVSIYYIMSEIGEQTELKIEFHFHPKPFWGWLLVPLIRFRSIRNLKKVITAIKEVSESSEELIYQSA
jgi:hypothetical protein